jgi:hypothetical protein
VAIAETQVIIAVEMVSLARADMVHVISSETSDTLQLINGCGNISPASYLIDNQSMHGFTVGRAPGWYISVP